VVAGDVGQALHERVEHVGVEGIVVAERRDDRLVRPFAQLLVVPLRRRHADHGHVRPERALLDHVVHGRKELLLGEITGDPEQDERVAVPVPVDVDPVHPRASVVPLPRSDPIVAAARAAARTISSTTVPSWARPGKSTSYAPGAIATPSSSNAWKNRA